MSTEQPPTNPFDRLTPQDYELPDFASLDPAVQAQLTAEGGPGWVQNPAEGLIEFSSVDEFRHGFYDNELGHGQNFAGLFAPISPILRLVAEQTAALQRFRLVHPELAAHLDVAMTAYYHALKTDRPNATITDSTYADMLKAYKIMSKMVDRSDAHVLDESGNVDPLCLVH